MTEVMYYICYKKKKIKIKITHACTEKMVCFSNIGSAFFECLPWSTGVDIQFVSLQGSPLQFSKHYSKI